MKLLIVESASKITTFQKILGDDYTVCASNGHVRDLPTNELGIQPPKFSPVYVNTERGDKTLQYIRRQLKDKTHIYLATDADREGEAIAWHLVDALQLPLQKCIRITTTEITPDAIRRAIANPGVLNMQLVAAQECRRIADRMAGWYISESLCDAIGRNGLSAGRVQSPAIRLIVERYQQIQEHKPIPYFEVTADTLGFQSLLDATPFIDPASEHFTDQALCDDLALLQQLTVIEDNTKRTRRHPPAPFTTSSLIQGMSSEKWNGERTMKVAQALYEKGLITYIRTDSKILSTAAIDNLHDFYSQNAMTPVDPVRTWTNKQDAQEAHEAIRPTNVHVDPQVLTELDTEQLLLYDTIRNRTLLTQLEPAIYETRKVTLQAELPHDTALFYAHAQTLLDPGYEQHTSLLPKSSKKEKPYSDQPGNNDIIPELTNGQQLAAKISIATKQTRAAKAYDESRLVAKLESLGIGRPSTYATLQPTLKRRNYITIDKNNIITPTDIAIQVVATLIPHCRFIQYGFTVTVESWLEKIAQGQATYLDIIAPLHEHLREDADNLQQQRFPCPSCGRALRKRQTKPKTASKTKTSGRTRSLEQKRTFWGCTGFFDKTNQCTYTCADRAGKPSLT